MSDKPEIWYGQYPATDLPGKPPRWAIDCGECFHYQDEIAGETIADEAVAKRTADGHAPEHPGIRVRKGRLPRGTRQELRLRTSHPTT
jgi:hypothetical protein